MFLVEEKTPQLLAKVNSGQLDAAILALPVVDENLTTKALFKDNFCLAVPKNHALAQNKKVEMADIASEELLLLEDGHCLRDQALQVCQLSGAKENNGFRATSLETLRQMVAAGSGITLMPEIAITAVKDPLISYIPFAGSPPSRMIGLVWRKSSLRIKPIMKIEELCRQNKLKDHL
jgi:LysR family hydrogen peroxide-inducible transcriptional activator